MNYLSDWSYISIDWLEGKWGYHPSGFQLDFNYIQLDLSNIYISKSIYNQYSWDPIYLIFQLYIIYFI